MRQFPPCGTCVFYKAFEAPGVPSDKGACWRYPPQAVAVQQAQMNLMKGEPELVTQLIGVRPQVETVDGCGEWAPRQPPLKVTG